MGFLDKLTGKARREEEARIAAEAEKKRLAEERKAKREAKKAEQAANPKKKDKVKVNPDKETATKAGEPYINIISVELDPNNIGNGAIELDWNEFFVAKLLRAGYQGRDDQQIVDQWFQDLCRNVLMENYEQWEANNPRPANGVQRRDLGDGRTEVS